ncbi:hypothetical protein LZ31DRAFT_336979 [Colletotrichum somersetense]|nr:hypothetical protein LZ31DRAFT_336979 [Colletotrichum somersetense]
MSVGSLTRRWRTRPSRGGVFTVGSCQKPTQKRLDADTGAAPKGVIDRRMLCGEAQTHIHERADLFSRHASDHHVALHLRTSPLTSPVRSATCRPRPMSAGVGPRASCRVGGFVTISAIFRCSLTACASTAPVHAIVISSMVYPPFQTRQLSSASSSTYPSQCLGIVWGSQSALCRSSPRPFFRPSPPFSLLHERKK